jgi:hypothetical protein
MPVSFADIRARFVAVSFIGGLAAAVDGGIDGVADALGAGAGAAALADAALPEDVEPATVPGFDGVDAALRTGAGDVAVAAALRFDHGGDEQP